MFGGQRADGVPADHRRRQPLLHAQQRRHLPARRRHRQGEVEERRSASCRPPRPHSGTTACSSRSLSGKITALSAKRGKVLWQKELGSRTESSPIVRRGIVYFGTEGGDAVRAVREDRPREVEVPAPPARSRPRPRCRGRPSTSATTAAACTRSGRARGGGAGRRGPPGRSSASRPGTSTRRPRWPSAACTPATRTARCTRSARARATLAWSHSTGGYVYSSPAVANVPGTRPTVYFGSYDGNLYALDARTGSTRWTARGGGRISGGPSVVGRIVYFADLDSKTTYGVDARTGERVFKRSRGYYNPVVSDGKRLYMTGYASVTALDPVKAGARKARSRKTRWVRTEGSSASPTRFGGGRQRKVAVTHESVPGRASAAELCPLPCVKVDASRQSSAIGACGSTQLIRTTRRWRATWLGTTARAAPGCPRRAGAPSRRGPGTRP